MPQGSQVEIMTPGTNEKHSLAGALDPSTGTLRHCGGPRQNNGLFRDWLQTLDAAYPGTQFPQVDVVVDHDKIQRSKAVEQSLANHLRFPWLWLLTSWPRANPIERAFGDVHDGCTRNHRRKRLRDLVADVEEHLQVNGPWP